MQRNSEQKLRTDKLVRIGNEWEILANYVRHGFLELTPKDLVGSSPSTATQLTDI
jgi:hypothetical protein